MGRRLGVPSATRVIGGMVVEDCLFSLLHPPTGHRLLTLSCPDHCSRCSKFLMVLFLFSFKCVKGSVHCEYTYWTK